MLTPVRMDDGTPPLATQLQLEGLGPAAPIGKDRDKGALKDPEGLRQIFRQFITANLKSDLYGRYYMSLLCTVVSSSDYSTTDIEPHETKPQLEGTPLIYKKLLTRRKTLKEMESIPGFPHLVLRLADCILSSLQEDRKKDAASRLLASEFLHGST